MQTKLHQFDDALRHEIVSGILSSQISTIDERLVDIIFGHVP